MKCPICGTIMIGTNHCPNCGYSLDKDIETDNKDIFDIEGDFYDKDKKKDDEY